MTLYELTGEMLELLGRLEELPPEDPEEREQYENAIRDTLSLVVMDFTDKAEGYGKVIAQLKADAEAVRAEKLRLSRKQQTIENSMERLRETVKNAMLVTGQKKVKTPLYSFTVSERRDLVIDAVSVFDIPEDFLRFKDPEPDKAKIKEYLKGQEECSFAHLEPTHSLTIR